MDQLTAQHLHFAYGSHVLMNDVTVAFELGKFYAVEGDNGTGKSTFLKVLVGLVQAQRGSVCYNEKDLAKLSVRERARIIAYMPSRRELSGNLDLETAISVGFPSATSTELNAVLERFELIDKRHRLLLQLSDGEYQRMQLARVYLQNTPVVILDEPTSHLDAKWRERFFVEMQSWAETQQKLVICSSHDLTLNMRYAHERISWPLVPHEEKETH